MSLEKIKRQAELLARENKEAEPDISKVYWFPDENEVRLVELHSTVPPSGEGPVYPYYFPPALADNLPTTSGVVLIRPEEYRNVELPPGWGPWSKAEEIGVE